MFQCPKCGKTYAHQSALSRHVHGNPKQRVLPCGSSRRSTTTQLLEDHVLEGEDVQGIDARSIVHSVNDVREFPVAWLTAVHLNPGRPHLWNVTIANVASKTLHVRQGGEWTYVTFKRWSRDFILNHTYLIYCRIKSMTCDERGKALCTILEHIKEVEESLQEALLGPLRPVIKKTYRLS